MPQIVARMVVVCNGWHDYRMRLHPYSAMRCTTRVGVPGEPGSSGCNLSPFYNHNGCDGEQLRFANSRRRSPNPKEAAPRYVGRVEELDEKAQFSCSARSDVQYNRRG